jgi:hypothetical protein
MLNPFEEDKETTVFITPTYNVIKPKNNICTYILIGCIYILEIFTATLAGLNADSTEGIFHSNLTPQYWLLPFAIYNIINLIMIYQFNQRTYSNKLYFIISEIIKIIWIIMGFVILAHNHLDIFIISYMIFYIIVEIFIIIKNIYDIKHLKQEFYL